VEKRQAKQVVVLSADEELQRRVAAALASKPNYHLLQRTKDPKDAYALGAQGALDLVFFDQRLSPSDPSTPVRELRDQLPAVPVVVLVQPEDADYVRRALLAGARSYLPLKFVPASLIETIDDLAGDGSRAPAPAARGAPGNVVVVTSLKGGVGRTMIATNLAVALREENRTPVVLVDGQLLHGDTEIDLNLSPQHSICDLIDQVDSLEPEVLDEALARHASGLRVLAACSDPIAARLIQPHHLSRILEGLRHYYAWIVVDTGNWMDERLDAILDAANVVLLVATPEMTALRAARVFLQMARDHDYPMERIRLVVNRGDLLGAIPGEQIERRLGVEAYATLADDSAVVAHSVNRGVPLVLSHGRKPLGRGLTALAEKLVTEFAPVTQESRGFSLFRRRAGGGQ